MRATIITGCLAAFTGCALPISEARPPTPPPPDRQERVVVEDEVEQTVDHEVPGSRWWSVLPTRAWGDRPASTYVDSATAEISNDEITVWLRTDDFVVQRDEAGEEYDRTLQRFTAYCDAGAFRLTEEIRLRSGRVVSSWRDPTTEAVTASPESIAEILIENICLYRLVWREAL